MTAGNSKSKPVSLFLVLLGALAFNLSSWPGEAGRAVASTSLSSVSDDCGNLEAQMKSNKAHTGTCSIRITTESGDTLVSKVSASVEKVTQYADLTSDAEETSTKIILKGDLLDQDVETDCDACMAGARLGSFTRQLDLSSLSDLRKIAIEASRSQAGDAVKEKENQRKRSQVAKARARKIEQCLIDESGSKLNSRETLNCRLAKIDEMDDEKAANYYDKYIQPEIQALINSNKPQNLQLAKQLIDQLGATANPYIRQSVSDLTAFATYKAKAESLSQQILTLPANDPRRSQAVAELKQLESGWGTYFKMRGMQTANLNPGWNGFDFAGNLALDMADYQAQLDQAYSAIVNRQAGILNVNNGANTGTTVINAGTGRAARGMPSTSYAGAPNVAGPATSATATTTLNGRVARPMSTQSTPATASRKPVVGSPVR